MSIYCPLSEALNILPPDHPIDYDDYSNCIPMDYIPIRHTDETKDAIRKSLTGKPKSEKHKQALRKPKKKGHKQSAEHKYKKAMNKSSKWIITYPDGQTEIIVNLSQFCRDNDLKYGQSNLIHGWTYKGYRAEKYGQITV
jgi:hypothetical protein